MTFHIPYATPIPASDIAAVRAWAAELHAPAVVLQMLLGDLAPAEEPKRRKLTASQVLEVRRLYSTGLPTIRIAERFGVSVQTVTGIVRGRTWKNLR